MSYTVEHAPEVKVYGDGAELPATTVLSVHTSMGGANGDVCRLRSVLKEHVENLTALLGVQTIVVTETSEQPSPSSGGAANHQGGTIEQVVFWGQTSGSTLDVKSEAIEFEARIGRHHFGTPLAGMIEVHPGGELRTLPQPLVFNPTIDGRTRGNMNDQRQGDGEHHVFIDYESLRTAKARGQQLYAHTSDQEYKDHYFDEMWTLAEAVLYLCWTLNAAQSKILNPTREQLQQVLSMSPELMRGVRLRLGLYLNEALDALLAPLGYGWFVRPPANRSAKPTLQFVERGAGRSVELLLQAVGELVDPERTNVNAARFATGWQTSVNQVRVLGGVKMYEATIELLPAWSDEFDDLEEDDLRKDSDSYANNTERQRVGRDWVFNEAGDYCGIRDGQNEPGNLSPIFGHEVVPRRRKFKPCLTRREDGTPVGENGIVLQVKYSDDHDWITPDEINDFGSWHVLEQELGIRFNGNHVPSEMWAYKASVRVRVTAVIVDDERLEYTAPRRPSSPQAETIEELLDAAERFQYRKLHASSIHYEDRAERDVDEQDDTESLQAYAERLRDAWDQADLSGTAEVIGLTGRVMELGMVVPKVTGREIILNARGDGAQGQRFPQIVAIRRDYVAQTRTLTLETFRDEAG